MTSLAERKCTILIEALETYWTKLVASAAVHNQACNEAKTAFATAVGVVGWSDHAFGVREDEVVVQLAETRARLFDGIVDMAESEFAPPGTKLSIDISPLRIGGVRAADYREVRRGDGEGVFSPVELWRALFQRFGKGQRDREAYAGVADQLVSVFHLRRDMEIRTVAGCVMVKSWSGTTIEHQRLSYHSSESLLKFISHLRAFAHWAHLLDVEMEGALDRLQQDARVGPYSMERKWLGGHVLLIPRKSQNEWRLSQVFVEQLQIFLQTYHRDWQVESAVAVAS